MMLDCFRELWIPRVEDMEPKDKEKTEKKAAATTKQMMGADARLSYSLKWDA